MAIRIESLQGNQSYTKWCAKQRSRHGETTGHRAPPLHRESDKLLRLVTLLFFYKADSHGVYSHLSGDCKAGKNQSTQNIPISRWGLCHLLRGAEIYNSTKTSKPSETGGAVIRPVTWPRLKHPSRELEARAGCRVSASITCVKTPGPSKPMFR